MNNYLVSVLDTKLSFDILNEISSENISFTGSAFEIIERNDKSIRIEKNSSYVPDPSKQVYFDLVLQVKDNADHIVEENIKIVIMTGVNNVTFGFDNSREHIESNKDKLFKILNETFREVFKTKRDEHMKLKIKISFIG